MTFDHITITDSQDVKVTVSGAIDRKGNPAPLDGPPTFTSADETIATFTTDPADPNTGIVHAVGGLTTATALSISADADLGSGVQTITVNGLVEITAGQAVGFATTVGDPTEQ